MRDEVRSLSDCEIDKVAGARAVQDGTSNTFLLVLHLEQERGSAGAPAAGQTK